MFFPKLRRRAKWVFAFIAVIFGLGFLVAGVGTGIGSGLGDYLSDLFNRQPGDGTPSVNAARERVRENPRDAEAQLELANALQAENRTAEAIAALEAYTEVEPNDENALQTLAGLYGIRASEADTRAQAAQVTAARAYFGSELVRDPSGPLAQELSQNPINQYVQQEATQAYTAAATEAQELYGKEADVWESLTKLDPDEPSFFRDFGLAAQRAGDAERAAAAYKSYLRLAPDAPEEEQVRELIKQLEASAGAGSP